MSINKSSNTLKLGKFCTIDRIRGKRIRQEDINRWKILFGIAIIFHIVRRREQRNYDIFLLFLSFLVVTFHSHTMRIQSYLCEIIIIFFAFPEKETWCRQERMWLMISLFLPYIYVIVLLLNFSFRHLHKLLLEREKKINHNYRFWKSDKLLFTLHTIDVLIPLHRSTRSEVWNSFIDIDVKIISNSLDRYLALLNEIDNILLYDMCHVFIRDDSWWIDFRKSHVPIKWNYSKKLIDIYSSFSFFYFHNVAFKCSQESIQWRYSLRVFFAYNFTFIRPPTLVIKFLQLIPSLNAPRYFVCAWKRRRKLWCCSFVSFSHHSSLIYTFMWNFQACTYCCDIFFLTERREGGKLFFVFLFLFCVSFKCDLPKLRFSLFLSHTHAVSHTNEKKYFFGGGAGW